MRLTPNRYLRILIAALLFGVMTPGTTVAQVPPGTLPFFYDLYTFRGERGTAVVGAYAVPARRLHRRERNGVFEYEIVVTLVVADTVAKSVSRMDDSVTVRLRRAPAADELVTANLEVNTPPTQTSEQRMIMTDAKVPGFGQLYLGGFPVPDYSGSQLMLSDVALGDAKAPGSWRRGDMTVSLLPTGRLPEGYFSVYYEIYNLPAGNTYTTDITIERMHDDDEPRDPAVAQEVRITFSGNSTAGSDQVVRELRRIESLLKRGPHRLTVVVRDQVTGQVAERSRTFRIGK